jgi:hypothetical protein
VISIELQEQLLAQERELDSREGALVALESDLATSECSLGRACIERDTEGAHAEAIMQDNWARLHAFMPGCHRSFNYN